MSSNYEEVVLEKALQVADATVWQGDMSCNFLTMAKAARVLAREVRRLQVYEAVLISKAVDADLEWEADEDEGLCNDQQMPDNILGQ